MTSHGGSEKPTNPDHLTLEAWSQGMMVGALIVMAMITAANMRAGVLLHKLVLLEVGGHYQFVLHTNAHTSNLQAGLSGAKRLLHLSQSSTLWLVLVVDCGDSHCFLEPTQCHRLAQKQAVLEPHNESNLHWNGDIGPGVLDRRDLRKFHILQRHQSTSFRRYEALRGTLSVRLPVTSNALLN